MSGVQRYAHNIFAEMVERIAADPAEWGDVALTLALPANVADPIPQSLARAFPLRGRLKGYPWEQLELPRIGGVTLNLCNLAPLAGRRNIVCIHDVNTYLAPYSYSWKYRAFQRVSVPLIGRLASAVTTVSHSSAKALERAGAVRDATRVTVAPNGHEHALLWRADRATITLGAITARPFVVMLGSAALHKNLALVRSIAPELGARGIDCVVTGGGAGVFATGTTDEAGPVITVGHVSDDDIALLFSRAVCLLFPSYVEGFGLPIVEAMALGCPVVSSDRSCMPEICGDAALLRSPDDPAAWIETITDLARTPSARSALIKAGHERVRHYRWKDSAEIYLTLARRHLESEIAARGTPAP